MTYSSADDVIALVDAIDDPDAPLDRRNLDRLAVDLPHLRRPDHHEESAWDLARFRALPPALRAVTSWFTVRAEVNNGGVDQLVWNQLAILPALIDAYVHVGAHGSATFLNDLALELVQSDPKTDGGLVEAFLAFRRRADVGRGDDRDVLDDVATAILRHARVHPEEYILEPVDEHTWSEGAERFRARIVRRADGLYEVAVDELVRSARPYWSELPRPAETAATLEAARTRAEHEATRTRIVSSLELAIESCSTMFSRDGRHWLWPSLPIDRLPQDAELAVRLRFPDGSIEDARARFRVELIGNTRCRGNVVLEPGARLPPDQRKIDLPPFWGAGWHAEIRVTATPPARDEP